MTGKRIAVVLTLLTAAAVLGLGSCSSGSSDKSDTTTTGANATTTTAVSLTPAADQTPPKGTNGIAVDGAVLWVADFAGSQILRVDRASGAILDRFGADRGVTTSDDVAVADDHTIYWTGLASGTVGHITADGTVTKVASVTGSVNPIAFAKDGTLYVGLTQAGTGLYAIDVATPGASPTLVAQAWDTNAFAFGPDGMLYGPKAGMNGAGAVDKVDVKTGEITEVKRGFNYPVSVRFDRDGRMLVLSTQGPALQSLDAKTGAVADVAKPLTAIVDNFAIAPDGTIYITSFNQNLVTVVAPGGATSTLTIGRS